MTASTGIGTMIQKMWCQVKFCRIAPAMVGPSAGATEKRWMRKPVVGMTTAMVSRKPVSSHWTTSAGTPKSAMTAGRATETVVSLRIIIAEMTRTASSAKTRRPSSFSSVAANGVAAALGHGGRESKPLD